MSIYNRNSGMLLRLAASLWMGVLSGCGMLDGYGRLPHQEGYSNVSISGDLMSLSPKVMTETTPPPPELHGIMIYFQRTTDDFLKSVYIPNEDFGSQSISIPNGTYKVYGIGFTSVNFGSGPRPSPSPSPSPSPTPSPPPPSAKCGIGTVGTSSIVALTGVDTQVNFNLSANNCQATLNQSITDPNTSSIFSNGNFIAGSQFNSITFVSCDSSSYDQVTTGNSLCTSSNSTSTIRSILVGTGSYVKEGEKVVFDADIMDGNPPIKTECIPFYQAQTMQGCDLANPSLGLRAGTSQKSLPLPVGNKLHNLPIPFGIKAFSDCNCTVPVPFSGTSKYQFGHQIDLLSLSPLGIISGTFVRENSILFPDGTGKAKLFLREPSNTFVFPHFGVQ